MFSQMEGRLLAWGIGWSKDEYEVSGVPYKDKGTRADEFLQALTKIWSDEIVEVILYFHDLQIINKSSKLIGI